MVFYAAFNSISVISRRQLTLFMLSWVSPVLGWALKCLAQGHSHEKNSEDPVRLEPRTPGLRVKHFTTEPRGTLVVWEKVKLIQEYFQYCLLIQNKCNTYTMIFLLVHFNIKTSILKVLHGNTKSPTGCIYSWRYNIILEVKKGI